jgi:hypothetical protein
LNVTMVKVQTLSIEESDNNVQNNRQHNGKHTRSHNRKVKEAVPSFDADIAGQSSQGNPKFRGQIHSPTDQDQDDPANY